MTSPVPNEVTQVNHRYSEGDSSNSDPFKVELEVKPNEKEVDVYYVDNDKEEEGEEEVKKR